MSIFRLAVSGMRDPKKAITLMGYKLLATVGDNKFRRFIVLAKGRTGSTLLISFLNSHPNIHADGEIFGKLSGRNHKDVLAKAFAKQPFCVKAKGFKILYGHAQDDKSNGIWDDISSMNDLYIIHLKRRNILRTLVSRKIAVALNEWMNIFAWEGFVRQILRGGGGGR